MILDYLASDKGDLSGSDALRDTGQRRAARLRRGPGSQIVHRRWQWAVLPGAIPTADCSTKRPPSSPRRHCRSCLSPHEPGQVGEPGLDIFGHATDSTRSLRLNGPPEGVAQFGRIGQGPNSPPPKSRRHMRLGILPLPDISAYFLTRGTGPATGDACGTFSPHDHRRFTDSGPCPVAKSPSL